MALKAKAPCAGPCHKQPTSVSCWAALTPPRGACRGRSRHICAASAAGDSTHKLPVVDDAISLPPPATGSQYAWRRSWGGSNSSTGSGGGGGAGRSWSQRTRDWGRGPNSSILFVILYRMRLLLLYGVWVTVLYGAFRALVDLTTAAGQAGYAAVNKAADLLYGSSSSSSGCSAAAGDTGSSGSGGSRSAEGQQASSVHAAAAGVEAEMGEVRQEPSPLSADAHDSDASVTHAAHSSDTIGAGSSGGASAGAAASQDLRARPTASAFENMMQVVIPVYLMLLGSVVFFASI